MPRYMVERTFTDGLQIPADAQGAKACLAVVEVNAADGVTWIHSYVSTDKETMVCVYEAPDPAAVRRAAALSELPVDRITPVAVLDPHFYR